MQNIQLHSTPWHWPTFALLVSFAATLALHGGALSMGFGRDDGVNLFNAVRLSPLVYFLDPATLSAVSAGALTPWNLLVYDISVTLFGLDPFWHHFHLLLVVASCGFATFLFLRLWLPPLISLAGAVLFLAGTPVVYISREEMSGHYLYGLLFTIVATHLFVRAVRDARAATAWASGLFYLLATACKEVFVPLSVVLLFLPEGTMAERLRRIWPLWLAAGLYSFWRWVAFEGSLLGGRSVAVDVSSALTQLVAIPYLLFGMGLVPVLAVVAYVLWRKPYPRAHLLWALIVAGALAAPLLPVTSGVGVHAPDRLLLLIWWVSACLLTGLVPRGLGEWRPAPMVILAALIAGQIWISQPWRAEISAIKHRWSQWYGWVFKSDETSHLVLRNDSEYFWQKVHIDGMRMAAKALGLPFNSQTRLINDIRGFESAALTDPARFVAFDAAAGQLRAARNSEELALWASSLPVKTSNVYRFKVMPLMAYQAGGVLDPLRIDGPSITVSGTAPPSLLGQEFFAFTSPPCDATPVATRDGRFQFNLICGSPQAAQQSAARLCLAVNNGDAVFVPQGQMNPDCQRLVER